MNITVLETEALFFETVAQRIAAQILKKPRALIGLSTGRTTGGIHAALAAIHKNIALPTAGLTVFGVDEITNVSRGYAGSCYYMLLNEVVKPLDIPMENYLMPQTRCDDFGAECRRFEAALESRGPVDLQVLGLGENGHLGFNQPGAPFGGFAWVSKMDAQLDERIRRETGSAPEDELGGLTLGIANIMHSKHIIMAANGKRKAQVVRDMLTGPVTELLPASVLQLHPRCEFILDKDAAALLQ